MAWAVVLVLLVAIVAALAFRPFRKAIGLMLVVLGTIASLTLIGLVVGIPMLLVGGFLLFVGGGDSQTKSPAPPHTSPTPYTPPSGPLTRLCPSCGSVVVPGAPYCHGCGQATAAPLPRPEQSTLVRSSTSRTTELQTRPTWPESGTTIVRANLRTGNTVLAVIFGSVVLLLVGLGVRSRATEGDKENVSTTRTNLSGTAHPSAIALSPTPVSTPTVAPSSRPVDRPTFVVNDQSRPCYDSPSLGMQRTVMAPGTVQAMDMLMELGSSTWYREVDGQCWTKMDHGSPGVFHSLEEAESFAKYFRPTPIPAPTPRQTRARTPEQATLAAAILTEQQLGPGFRLSEETPIEQPYVGYLVQYLRLSSDSRSVFVMLYRVGDDANATLVSRMASGFFEGASQSIPGVKTQVRAPVIGEHTVRYVSIGIGPGGSTMGIDVLAWVYNDIAVLVADMRTGKGDADVIAREQQQNLEAVFPIMIKTATPLDAHGSGNGKTTTFDATGAMDLCWQLSGSNPFLASVTIRRKHDNEFIGVAVAGSKDGCKSFQLRPGTYYLEVIATVWSGWRLTVRPRP
jgi:hypothetical protein